MTTGYTAIDIDSGKRIASQNGSERFPMGSVFKFPIALAVLHRVDRGDWKLSESITIEPKDFSVGWSPLRDAAKGKPFTVTLKRLIEAMLGESDNTAVDYFIRRIGAAALTREVATPGIRIDRTEKEMAAQLHAKGGHAEYAKDVRDTATPDAMAALLVRFWRNDVGLSKESHAMAVRIMTGTKTGLKRMKAVLPAGATLAHKTGTMPGTVNDVGVVTLANGRHIAIAIFTKEGTSEKAAEAKIRRVAAQLIP